LPSKVVNLINFDFFIRKNEIFQKIILLLKVVLKIMKIMKIMNI
jgi:hypothetical protein